MLTRIVLLPVNHLLSRERWAREALAPFAGRAFRLRWRALSAAFSVTAGGTLAAASDVVEAVEIVLPDDAPLALAGDPASVVARAQLRGPADFCEALAFVARNLRWDAEADLAQVVGDIPARRVALGLAAGKRWQQDATARFKSGIAAALAADDNALLLSARRFGAHREALQALVQDIDALETRLARLNSA